MTLKPFKSREGFDASGKRGINFQDPRPDTDPTGAQDATPRDWVLAKIKSVGTFALIRPTQDKETLSWNATSGQWDLVLPLDQLSKLRDVSTTAPTDGQVLKWDASSKKWISTTLAFALNDLTDVQATSPANGDVLTYDSAVSAYVLKPPLSGQIYTATSDQLGAQTGTPAQRAAAVFTLVAGATVTAKEGDVMVVTRGTNPLYDRYAGPFFYDGTAWVQGGGIGGGGSGNTVTYRASLTTPVPTTSSRGDLNVVTASGDKEINAYNGTAFQLVLGEREIKSWISAGSLFQGNRDVVATSTTAKAIADLPTPDATNRSFYWTWTGPASTVVTPADFPGGHGFSATLQVGDWIQSDGTNYIHVPSDLLSKLRWESVGAFLPWADANWEANSLVTHTVGGRLHYFKATTAVTAGDFEPGVQPPAVATSGTSIRLSMPDGLADGTRISLNFALVGSNTDIDLAYITVPGDSVASQLAAHIQAALLADPLFMSRYTPTLTAGYSVTVQSLTGPFTATADRGITQTVTAGGMTTNKWQDITPTHKLDDLTDVDLTTTAPVNQAALVWDQLLMQWKPVRLGLGDLDKMNANVIDPDLQGAVLVWDDLVDEWVASDTLQIGAIRFGDEGTFPEITGFASNSFIDADPDDASFVPSVYAVKEYITNNRPRLEELEDCTQLATAEEGQVPVWNDTAGRWEPKTLTSPIIYLGSGAWVAANVAARTQNYGMPAGTVPDPQVWTPQPGDQYIDLTSGNVTVFTSGGATVPSSPAPGRTDPSAITGGASPTDLVPNRLNDLSDVTITTPATNQLLRFNTDHWENWTPDYYNATTAYSKVEVDTKLATLTTTLEHEESVMAIANDPPAAPTLNDLYITGTVPTGLWAGKVGKLARWDGAAWQFTDPRTNETHLVEDVAETWHWNGTAWVKVAAATTASAVSVTPVGTIIQSLLTAAQFQTAMGADGAKWRLAAGGDCTGTAYATLTGSATLPDLRGAFLRMAGANINPSWSGGALNSFSEDSTKRPNTAFTGATNYEGAHVHTNGAASWGGDAVWHGTKNMGTSKRVANWDDWSPQNPYTSTEGNHAHTVTINGGGDAETKPKSYAVNYFIKVN